jgi:hypothetical protein
MGERPPPLIPYSFWLLASQTMAKITADSATDRLHEPKRCIGGNRGIDGRTTVFKDIDGDFSGERLSRSSHPMACNDLRSRREMLAGNPVYLTE